MLSVSLRVPGLCVLVGVGRVYADGVFALTAGLRPFGCVVHEVGKAVKLHLYFCGTWSFEGEGDPLFFDFNRLVLWKLLNFKYVSCSKL